MRHEAIIRFLLKIKQAPQLLTLKELRIRVNNMKNPTEVSVNMDITGFMLSSQPAETDTTTDKDKNKEGRS